MAAGVWLCAAVLPSLAASPADGELQGAEARLEQVVAELDAAEARRGTRAEQVAAARERVEELESVLNETLMTIRQQEARVGQVRAEVDRVQREIQSAESELAERARDMYMRQVPPVLSAVLSGGGVEEVTGGMEMLQVLNSRGRASIESLAASREQLRVERERLAAERQRLASMRDEQEALLARATATLEERQDDLAAVEARRAALRAQREDLTEESARVAEQLGANGNAGSGAAGRYVWPLCRTVTSEYGPRWGRMHEGIDIDGNTGTPIRAANSGTVVSAGWSGGYGNLTLIEHADGVVTAYAHQSRIDVRRGQQVSRGATIGAVGATGNVTGPHLHFETRVGGGTTNPRRYLPSGC